MEKGRQSIRHEKILIAPEHEVATPAVRRYSPTRSWPVGGLALVAAAGVVLAAGALSSALDGAPDSAFAARIGQSVASLRPNMEAHAAIPAPAALAPLAAAGSEPSPAGGWRIQVGAFRTLPAAEAHVRTLKSELPELARLPAIHQLRGDLNRVRIGGIGEKAAARRLCARILATGRGCFVVGPESQDA